MLVGYIDLVVATRSEVIVIDFKTDAPPPGPAGDHYPLYAEQVRAYVKLLQSAGVGDGRSMRAALLFTGDGTLHWV